ncbi:response regulator [Rhabdobacter roseus]|uniref:CheY-like chemotaxis protein n=1 Tax=Rhabdobacter roseus TaxID=1655419 RepID=A0A840TSD8_9BACT|nr:response regulator [Rhabdobacter roseus]MBB5287286.1 CheY-like chemotaxis protein [Rhabdobacter roseus]
MAKSVHDLVLADDDADDCIFFREALEEIPVAVTLTTVKDGVELMELLTNRKEALPDLVFLDLNMPRKTGLECLTEIKANDALKKLPVIIYSTSMDREMVNLLYKKGAHYYIRKPGEFSKLKESIYTALALNIQQDPAQPAKEQFVIKV